MNLTMNTSLRTLQGMPSVLQSPPNPVVDDIYLVRCYIIDAGQEIGRVLGHSHD